MWRNRWLCKSVIVVTMWALSFLGGDTPALAASSFQGLGHLGGGTSSAADVSADGLVVVGTSNNGTSDEAFRWTAAQGMAGLGTPAGGSSAANAASADGSVIVGRRNDGSGDEAFRWTAASGIQGLGVLTLGPEDESEAFGVSADGTVIVGVSGVKPKFCSLFGPPFGPRCPGSRPFTPTEQAFRWTDAGGMVGLGTLPIGPNNGSIAHGISADGSIVVGEAFGYFLFCFPQHGGGCVYNRYLTQAFLWQASSGIQNITGMASQSVANGISANGVHVVGANSEAARWTSVDGFVSLGIGTSATDASADGSVIVGGTPAFVWRQHGGYVKIALMLLYNLNLAGWVLDDATGVSDDGLTIVGSGTNPLGSLEGWVAKLDTLPDPNDLAALPPLVSGSVPLLSAILPRSRSAQVGSVVTVFATVFNTGNEEAVGCRIALATPVSVVLDYQMTDPITNLPVGSQNTPVNIPAGGARSFVIGFTPTAAFAPTDVRLSFDCANTPRPASSDIGLNTVLLSASTTPVPDVVALVATLTGNGIVELDPTTGAGVFAVATVNLGAAARITASVDVGTLPISAAICPTNSVTGACLAAPAAQVQTMIATNATPSFGIFLTGTGSIPLDPRTKRVFVNFTDGNSSVRGSTSVAVHK